MEKKNAEKKAVTKYSSEIPGKYFDVKSFKKLLTFTVKTLKVTIFEHGIE